MFAKPPSPKRLKARQQRQDAQRAKAFRTAVWQRDGYVCRSCGHALYRLDPDDGEYPGYAHRPPGHVHHLRGRNVAPEDRYNPDAAVLLCSGCHRAVHDGRIKLSV